MLNGRAWAADCDQFVPDGADWGFARLILGSEIPVSQRLRSINRACKELDPDSPVAIDIREVMPKNNAEIDPNSSFSRAVIATTVAAEQMLSREPDLGTIGLMLFGEKNEKAFANELSAIKKIYDPRKRTALTVQLVSKYRGKYDVARTTQPDGLLISPPSKVLRLAGRGENSGICRDFANLLQFALNDVGRVPPGFHARSYYGNKHAWVQVNVQTRTKNGSYQWDKVYFDPTYYFNSDEFVALPERKISMQNRTTSDQCKKIESCLFQENLKSGRSQNRPASTENAPAER